VSDNWLQSFHDPQLDALVAEAIATNLDLAQVAQHLESARQSVVVISSQLKPQVSLDFGAATLRDASQSTNHNSSRGIFGIGWEPDVWGKLRAERAAAKERYAATAFDYAWARQSLAATTAQSWYQTVALRQILAIEDETAKAYAELLRLATINQAAGQVADLDVAEATANLNEAQDRCAKRKVTC
jgi:outer membrane protein TolC